MNPIFINKEASITSGLLDGVSGLVVGADASSGTVTIEIEEETYITVLREKIFQEGQKEPEEFEKEEEQDEDEDEEGEQLTLF